MRKIVNYQPIHKYGVQCGYLQIIQSTGSKAVEIEYHLDKKYRKQGIMSNFLPGYLATLERKGFGNIIAHVKRDNYASKKLLKRNKFFKFSEVRDVEIFIKTNLIKE